MMKELRIGLIGAGNIARTHLNSYKKIPGAKVVAICDINEEILNSTGNAYGIEKRFTSVEDMLKSTTLDAADVCVWNCNHAKCAIAALDAGLNTLCEKPMAMNAEEAEAMEAAAIRNNKLLMLGFVTRFSNEARIAKEFIADGKLGEIYYSKAIYLRRNGCPGGWFSDKSKSGGGPIIDIGVHPLDLTRYLMGNPEPVSVSAVSFDKLHEERAQLKTIAGWMPKGADARYDKNDVEDSAVAIIRYANGAATLLETSYALNCIPKTERELYGTKGGISFGDNGLKIFTEVNGFMANVDLQDLNFYREKADLFDCEMNHFVDCCLNGTKCDSPAHDGVVIMKILDALYESAKTGKEVTIK
ncbi:MAG: Gfo/Idh/MocA family oxidoreductase [Bacillota bacterium]|nr:Gfo/Idh/MocA family oxidoreductase [Bacillota bacterium]